MVYVYASVQVKKGRVQDFIKLFKTYSAEVKKEPGCIDYLPAVDLNTGSPFQTKDENSVYIIEKWKDMGSLGVHLNSPAFQKEQEKEKDMVEGVMIKIMQEA
jgi:quinol monooxygenase YgiN